MWSVMTMARPQRRTLNKTRLLTEINSVLRISNQRVFETPYFDQQGFGRYRISEYHHIDFASEVPAVVSPDVDLEVLGRELGVLGPYVAFEGNNENAGD
jgi:hypothetical protein